MASWIPNPIYGDPNGGDYIDDTLRDCTDAVMLLDPDAAERLAWTILAACEQVKAGRLDGEGALP